MLWKCCLGAPVMCSDVDSVKLQVCICRRVGNPSQIYLIMKNWFKWVATVRTTESHSLGETCLVANQDKQIDMLSVNGYVQQLESLRCCNFLCFHVLVTSDLVY